MRHMTLALLFGGILGAQTPNWRPPDLGQYFRQYKFPEIKPQLNTKEPTGTVVKCAVPLVNALKKDNTRDHMVFHPPRSQTASVMTVPPPMPSCDDVR